MAQASLERGHTHQGVKGLGAEVAQSVNVHTGIWNGREWTGEVRREGKH